MKLGTLLLFLSSLAAGANFVSVKANGLNCGAVARAVDQVQTYCYDPSNKVIWNEISTVNVRILPLFVWCSPQTTANCTFNIISWDIKQNATGGFDYQVTGFGIGTGTTLVQSGSLTFP